MKKTYIQPTMKVRKIQCSHMLCGSNDVGINSEAVSEEKNEYSGYEGYGYAW